jgi:hypothetical protein
MKKKYVSIVYNKILIELKLLKINFRGCKFEYFYEKIITGIYQNPTNKSIRFE